MTTRLLIVIATGIWMTPAVAQKAEISGFILDPADAAVSGASINLRNELTGGRRTTTSNDTGFYSLPSLAPGTYRLSVRSPNFQTIIREGLVLQVGDVARVDFTLRVGDARTSVTVKSGSLFTDTEAASVGTLIDRSLIEQMPLNGRGLQSLIELTPGVVLSPVTTFTKGQFAVNGQRNDANYFTVDGISLNFAAPVTTSRGNATNGDILLGGGHLPSLSQLGTFSNLISPEAIQEFRTLTSTFSPEFGRFPGAQVELLSRSGANRFSGSLFGYVRNEATDANDWFNNSRGRARPVLRFNNFGGTLGGPVLIPRAYNGRDRTFFFLSVEDLTLSQRVFAGMVVPSLQSRNAATGAMNAYLNAFPIPNRSASDYGLTLPGRDVFIANRPRTYDQPTYGLRVDHSIGDKLSVFARYNDSPSVAEDLSTFDSPTIQHFAMRTRTFTVGLTHAPGTTLVNEFRGNFSSQSVAVEERVAGYGEKVPDNSLLFPPSSSSNNRLLTVFDPDIGLSLGTEARALSRQLQFLDNVSYARGTHRLRSGIDFRRLTPVDIAPQRIIWTFNSIYRADGTINDIADSLQIANGPGRTSFVFRNFSAYLQDIWRATRRFTMTYGLRWDIDPAPRLTHGSFGAAQFTSIDDLPRFSALPSGRPFYRTEYTRLAPRIGIAWQLSDRAAWKTALRAGAGLFHDTGQNGFDDAIGENQSWITSSGVRFGSYPANGTPVSTVQGWVGAVPKYRLPLVYEWNATIEQAFGQQTLSVAYIGALGRRLAGSTHDLQGSTFISVLGTRFRSEYHALEAHFQRRLPGSTRVLVSYTWSHSIDNRSNDRVAPGLADFRQPDIDRGSSDFDIRQNLNAAMLADLPAPHSRFGSYLLRNWSARSMIFARTAPPTDLSIVPDPGDEYRRPDLVFGPPLYLYGSGYPGGKRFNPAAFSIPQNSATHGTLGRNVLRGFGAWQVDLALQRKFSLSEGASVQFRVEAFNLFNHPNFANPSFQSGYPQIAVVGYGGGGSPFGYSTAMLADSLGPSGVQGQLNPVFQVGAPRSLQFGMRVGF